MCEISYCAVLNQQYVIKCIPYMKPQKSYLHMHVILFARLSVCNTRVQYRKQMSRMQTLEIIILGIAATANADTREIFCFFFKMNTLVKMPIFYGRHFSTQKLHWKSFELAKCLSGSLCQLKCFKLNCRWNIKNAKKVPHPNVILWFYRLDIKIEAAKSHQSRSMYNTIRRHSVCLLWFLIALISRTGGGFFGSKRYYIQHTLFAIY